VVARRTGGLADTVADDDTPGARGRGNGFLFEEASADAFAEAVRRALAAHADAGRWEDLVVRVMGLDHSWAGPAAFYLEAYRRALELHTAGSGAVTPTDRVPGGPGP
jgi:starch synthase